MTRFTGEGTRIDPGEGPSWGERPSRTEEGSPRIRFKFSLGRTLRRTEGAQLVEWGAACGLVPAFGQYAGTLIKVVGIWGPGSEGYPIEPRVVEQPSRRGCRKKDFLRSVNGSLP